MSSGPFVLAIYQSDAGNFYNARVQPETTAMSLQGTIPTTAVNSEPSAIMKGSRRGIGVNARNIRVRFTAAPPAGYSPGDILTIPILNPTAWAAITKGTTGTYLGIAVIVVGKTPEYVN